MQLEDKEEYDEMMAEVDSWENNSFPEIIPNQEHIMHPVFKTQKEQDIYLEEFNKKIREALEADKKKRLENVKKRKRNRM